MAHYISRRRFLQTATTTASAATLGSVLAACGGGPGSSSSITITYWDHFVTESPYYDNEIKLFQKKHPDIKIKRVSQSSDNYDNLYALAERSKNTPDIALIPQNPAFYDQIKKGWWQPLDKWATKEWRAKFPALALHEGSNIFNGKLYSAPFEGLVVPFQLYINNQLFREAGLVNADGSVKVPRTWDDVTHAAEAITKKSNGQVYGLGFGNGGTKVLLWWLFVFLIGADCPGGPGDMDLRVGKYTYASNRAYGDWMRLFKEWKEKGYMYPNSLSISDEVSKAYFERGKYAMTVGGIWNQAPWVSHGFKDFSLTTLISPEAEPRSYFPTRPGGMTFAISAHAKNPDAAWAWLDWLYSVEAGKRFVQQGRGISIYPQNNDPKNNTFPPFSQYVGTAKYSVTGPDPTIRNPATSYVTISNPVHPDLTELLTGYYTGQVKDLDAALLELQQKSQAKMEEAIKLANQQGHKVSIKDYIFTDWKDLKKPYITEPGKGY
ncbi:ABC-type glycerol-3-phosphate transport system substrate-binding protein [Thermosporothrix hazakensis]|jgi:ABC-type glycerol-3-phosphate transport system substrate-binding protein|uniref:ABC-type glycerol-3-phosphate transport system substrate-binding protein n=1 Tax=Thermosporothrix hazakensis TaxID=644383 RepID=A0A326U1Y3_THEHA|nr:extracellular solute-binding protein [Thermosporothrix hazakensis]PZW25279.1 ABC-type glycerol-3-phosphate transport system substrate-binding protein [Thermosporothrix hazakensis]GCE50511.1 sugar ABC transporter substrate-binding protein [Thermosporothrix hazakensis]